MHVSALAYALVAFVTDLTRAVLERTLWLRGYRVIDDGYDGLTVPPAVNQ